MSTRSAINLVFIAQFAWLASFEIFVLRGNQPEGGLFGPVFNDLVMLAAVPFILGRSIRSAGRERLAWLLIAIGSTSWIGGEIYYDFVLTGMADPPAPSWADVGYLGFIPCVTVGILLLTVSGSNRVTLPVLLDGVAAAAALAALSSGLVMGDVLSAYADNRLAVIVNGAYPVTDAMMLGLAAGCWALRKWRIEPMWTWIGLGLFLFWLSDSVYLSEVAQDAQYYIPNVVDGGWTACMVFLGVAATRQRDCQSGISARAQVLLPSAFAVLGVSILIATAVVKLHPLGVVFAAVSAISVLLRLVATLRSNALLLSDSVREATTDHLTGLGNRRSLIADLDGALVSGRSVCLGLYDLDGFKAYNDAFGHLAGDALLSGFGSALAEFVDTGGRAFRLGGDEFCLISYEGDGLLAEAAAHLSSESEWISVRPSYGVVRIPDEAETASEALRLADQRMYAKKAAGRRGLAASSVEVATEILASVAPDTATHALDVAELVKRVGGRRGWPMISIEQARVVALLRELGRLDPSVTAVNLPLASERFVSGVSSLAHLAELVRASYARFDGAGAAILAGHDIPREARLVAVCDAYVQQLHPAHGPTTRDVDALAGVSRLAGTTLDPAYVASLYDVVLAPATDDDLGTSETPADSPPPTFPRGTLLEARSSSGPQV